MENIYFPSPNKLSQINHGVEIEEEKSILHATNGCCRQWSILQQKTKQLGIFIKFASVIINLSLFKQKLFSKVQVFQFHFLC